MVDNCRIPPNNGFAIVSESVIRLAGSARAAPLNQLDRPIYEAVQVLRNAAIR